jgi:Apea-like HEPN
MRAAASLTVRHTEAQSIEAVRIEYQLLEDLCLLLTGTPYLLKWPELRVGRRESHTLYFMKVVPDTNESPPKYHECVTNYIQLRAAFGSIWSQWKKSREELGPGVYFYIGARKRSKMYVEHRFVNLVWGLEAFHRKKSSDSSNQKLRQKLDRIISQVELPSDKKWLETRFKNAHEPVLGDRLFQTLSLVPIDLATDRLRSFAADCARLRNDISHFGEARHGRTYNEFITDTASKADALSTLYHMLLLHEIGVESKILKWWVFEGFKSFPIKHTFVKVGLLDKSTLEKEMGASE